MVSVLYREPKLLKAPLIPPDDPSFKVSVLYREPKLLKGKIGSDKTYLCFMFQCSTVSRNC